MSEVIPFPPEAESRFFRSSAFLTIKSETGRGNPESSFSIGEPKESTGFINIQVIGNLLM
jgi:hypothetical protein